MLCSRLSQTHQIDFLRNIFENIEDIVNILKKILTKPPFLIIYVLYISQLNYCNRLRVQGSEVVGSPQTRLPSVGQVKYLLVYEQDQRKKSNPARLA